MRVWSISAQNRGIAGRATFLTNRCGQPIEAQRHQNNAVCPRCGHLSLLPPPAFLHCGPAPSVFPCAPRHGRRRAGQDPPRPDRAVPGSVDDTQYLSLNSEGGAGQPGPAGLRRYRGRWLGICVASGTRGDQYADRRYTGEGSVAYFILS